MDRSIGTCGHCGGAVTTPEIWMGLQHPTVRCESCGRKPKDAHGPKMDMEDSKKLGHVEYGGNMRCMTSDGRIVNMAEELNRNENPSSLQKETPEETNP